MWATKSEFLSLSRIPPHHPLRSFSLLVFSCGHRLFLCVSIHCNPFLILLLNESYEANAFTILIVSSVIQSLKHFGFNTLDKLLLSTVPSYPIYQSTP